MALTKRQQVVLAAVQESPGVTVADLAERCQLHRNSVRAHLKALHQLGYVRPKTQHTHRRGRPVIGYVATAAHPETVHHDMATLIDVLLTVTGASAQEIASAWAAQLPQVTTEEDLSDMLSQLGFAPSPTLQLTRCPYTPRGGSINPKICEVHRRVLATITARHLQAQLLPRQDDGTCHIQLQQGKKDQAHQPSP